ncbi:Uncharacterised protein [Blautia hydrogenotrophica]|nr:Uncharacterised protein [Blautia hydrogenotrophica]SCH90928.1 Uncharacterised protein [uncultured Blautia sp.]
MIVRCDALEAIYDSGYDFLIYLLDVSVSLGWNTLRGWEESWRRGADVNVLNAELFVCNSEGSVKYFV